MPVCFHAIIAGRVQGVYYRAGAQRKARSLALVGWVQNLPDGRVELMAQGEPNQLELYHQWLWKGPIAAKVTDVIWEQTDAGNVMTDFEVKR